MSTVTLKKLFSVFLSILLLLSMFPASVFAASEVDYGTCGDTLSWSLTDDGTLTISGFGEMSVEPFWFMTDKIKRVVICEGVSTVGESAFFNCHNLQSVIFLGSVVSIEGGAFYNCDSLTDITLPYSVTSIGSYAFSGCTNLSSISLPSGLTHMGQGVFRDCSSLTSVVLSESMATVSSLLFQNCHALTSVTMGSGVTVIEYAAFQNCESLKHADIPKTVESIGQSAFENCSALTGISFGPELTRIESHAFELCSSLTELVIPSSVEYIGESAFQSCYDIKSLTIKEGVTEIGEAAFWGCSGLDYVVIPRSLHLIRQRTFYSCVFSDVYYGGSIEEWYALHATDTVFGYCTIHYNCSGGLRPSQNFSFGNSSDSSARVRFGVYDYKTGDPLEDAECSYSEQHLKITLDGYETVDIPDCTLEEKHYLALTLVPTSLNSHIAAVHCDGRDGLTNEVKVLSTAKPFDIYVYGSGASYQLFRDYPSGITNKIDESADGHFTVDPATLTDGKCLYVRAVAADGKAGAPIRTNICVKDVLSKVPKLSGKTMFVVPDDIPVIGGSKFKFDLSFLPVTFQQDGNTVKIGIGCTENLLKGENSSENWLKWKKFVEKQDKKLKKGLNAMMVSSNQSFWQPFSGGMDTDLDCSCYGFIEGTFADDGKFSRAAGFLMISLGGSFSQEWQTMAWVIPIVLKAKADVGFDQVYSVDLDIENSRTYIDGSMSLTLPKIRLSAGVGIAYVADLSVYGSASNKIELRFVPSYVKATLSGELGVSVKALIWSGEKSFLKGDWEYYNSGRAYSRSLQSVKQGSMPDEDDYHLDRSYADTQSGWYTEHPPRMRLMSYTGNGSSETTVQSSVYYSADPQLVITDDGTRIMVWTADIPERSTGNHLAAVYSVYDENSDKWSVPVIVDDDGTLDASVTAEAYGSKVYIAWSDAKSADFTDETTMADLAASLEISAAVYDTETGNVSVSRLTDNANADLRPVLSADENGVYAAWVENGSADLLQMSGINNIRYSAFDGSTWSEPMTFVSLEKPVAALNIGTLGESVHIAYTADADGDYTTAEDVELFCGAVGSSASALTDNESIEQSPQFVEWLGMPALVWYDAGSIFVFDGDNTASYYASKASIGAEFAVENGRILSVQHSDDGSMLYSSDILDDEIGNSVALTDNADYVAAFSAASNGSTTYVAFTRRSAVIGEESIVESTDLCVAEIEGFHDLTLLSAEVDEADAAAGGTVPVTLMVKNNGLFDENDILVTGTLYGVEKVSAVCDTPVVKGDTVAMTVQLPLENTIEPETEYVFSVAPVDAEDRNARDNESGLIIGHADLQLAADLIGSGDNKIALIDVSNLSSIDTNAILHIYDDDEERTQLAAYDIGSIAAGTWELYEIDCSLLPQLREVNRILYFTVEAAEKELLTGDNSAFLYLQSRPKNLAITVSVNGVDTDFRCEASDVSRISAAAYDHSGKMVAMRVVDCSADSENVRIALTDSAVQQGCTIKVFLLDENWCPVTTMFVSEL